MRDGDAVMTGSAIVNAGSATGTAQNFATYDTTQQYNRGTLARSLLQELTTQQ